MSEWQPIETAPKDGTTVLLFCPKDFSMHRPDYKPPLVVVGWWRGEREWPRNVWVSDVGESVGDYDCGHYFEVTSLEPTHWMPLPEPPA